LDYFDDSVDLDGGEKNTLPLTLTLTLALDLDGGEKNTLPLTLTLTLALDLDGGEKNTLPLMNALQPLPVLIQV